MYFNSYRESDVTITDFSEPAPHHCKISAGTDMV